MMKYSILMALVAATLAFAAGDMDFAKSKCVSIDGPNLVTVEGLDQIRLVGIRPPGEESKYHDEAKDYLEDKLLGNIVRIEVDPDKPKSASGQIRAVVYYDKDGKWINIGIELIENGCAEVAYVPGSYFDTKVYFMYEKEARKEKRGLWEEWHKEQEEKDKNKKSDELEH